MAVQTITYDNKVALNTNPDIANVNKVQDSDMNEIKSVVNNNASETQNLQNNRISDLIQVGLTTNPFSVQANTLTQIPFNTVTAQIGTNLSLSNGKIVVGGNGLSGKIKITFCTFGSTTTTLDYCYAYIYKNSTETADMYNAGSGANNRFVLTQELVLDYQSGDEFSVSYGALVVSALTTSYYRTILKAEILTY